MRSILRKCMNWSNLWDNLHGIHLADTVIYIVLLCRRRWQLKQILWQDIVVGPGAHRHPWSALLIRCKSEHETSSRSASGAPFRPFQVLKKTLPKCCWSWNWSCWAWASANLSQNQPTNKRTSTLWSLFWELSHSVALLWQSKVISIYTMSFMC